MSPLRKGLPSMTSSEGNQEEISATEEANGPRGGWRASTMSTIQGFAALDKFPPNFRDRILELLEQEFRYQKEMKVREQRLHYRMVLIGQVSAVFLTLTFLGVSTFLIVKGFTLPGIVIVFLGVTLLLSNILVGRPAPTSTSRPPKSQISQSGDLE
jgi:uncharacterized membrane protein